MEKLIDTFDSSPLVKNYKSLGRRFLIGQKIDEKSPAEQAKIYGNVLEAKFSSLPLSEQVRIYTQWCNSDCAKKLDLSTNKKPDGVYLYPSSHQFQSLIDNLYSQSVFVSLDTQSFLSRMLFEDNKPSSIGDWLGHAKEIHDTGRNLKTLGDNAAELLIAGYAGYRWWLARAATLSFGGFVSTIALAPVLYYGYEALVPIKDLLCRESILRTNALKTLVNPEFQHTVNQSTDNRFSSLKKLIKETGIDTNDTVFDLYDKIPDDTGNSEIDHAKRTVQNQVEVFASLEKAADETDPIKRKEHIEEIQTRIIKKTKDIIECTDPTKTDQKAELRLTKEELLVKITGYQAGAQLFIDGVTIGLHTFGYRREAEVFQRTADTLLSLAVIGVSTFFHLMHPVQAIITGVNEIVNYLQWLWSGDTLPNKDLYLEEIRNQIEVLKLQLDNIYVVQIEILNQLSNLTRKIHEDHQDIFKELYEIKASLSLFHLSLFSDERSAKQSKLLRWQKQAQLQLTIPVEQFDLAHFLSSFNKIFAYASNTSRLIQFSGNSAEMANFEQIRQQLLHHKRSDLSINSLISLYNALGCYYDLPDFHPQRAVVVANPTEWLRAATFIVETLLVHMRPDIKQFGDVSEKVTILYADALTLRKSIAMLANHKNIRSLMKQFSEKLPFFLSACVDYVDREINKRMKNAPLFLGKSSITSKEPLPEKLPQIQPGKIDILDKVFLENRVCKQNDSSKANYAGCYLFDHDKQRQRLFRVHEDLGQNPFSGNNFSVIDQYTQEQPTFARLGTDALKTKLKHIWRRSTKIRLSVKADPGAPPSVIPGTRYDYVVTNDTTNQAQFTNPHMSIFIFDICIVSHTNFFEFLFECEKKQIDLVKRSLLDGLRTKVIERTDGTVQGSEQRDTYHFLQQCLLSIVSFSSLNQLYQGAIYDHIDFESWFEIRFPYEDPIGLFVDTVLRNCSDKKFADATKTALRTVTETYGKLFESISSSLSLVNQHRELPILDSIINRLVYCAYLYDIPLPVFNHQKPSEYLPQLVHREDTNQLKRYFDDPAVPAKDLLAACYDSNLAQVTRMCELGVLNLSSSDELRWPIIKAALLSLNLDIIELVFSYLGQNRTEVIYLLSCANLSDNYLTHIEAPGQIFRDITTLLAWFTNLTSNRQNVRLIFNQLMELPKNLTEHGMTDPYGICISQLRKVQNTDSEVFVKLVESVKRFYEHYQARIREVVTFIKKTCEVSVMILPVDTQMTIKDLLDLIQTNRRFSRLFFMQDLHANGPHGGCWVKMIQDDKHGDLNLRLFISADNESIRYPKSLPMERMTHEREDLKKYPPALIWQYQMTVVAYEFAKFLKIVCYLNPGEETANRFFSNKLLKETFTQFAALISSIFDTLSAMIQTRELEIFAFYFLQKRCFSSLESKITSLDEYIKKIDGFFETIITDSTELPFKNYFTNLLRMLEIRIEKVWQDFGNLIKPEINSGGIMKHRLHLISYQDSRDLVTLKMLGHCGAISRA